MIKMYPPGYFVHKEHDKYQTNKNEQKKSHEYFLFPIKIKPCIIHYWTIFPKKDPFGCVQKVKQKKMVSLFFWGAKKKQFAPSPQNAAYMVCSGRGVHSSSGTRFLSLKSTIYVQTNMVYLFLGGKKTVTQKKTKVKKRGKQQGFVIPTQKTFYMRPIAIPSANVYKPSNIFTFSSFSSRSNSLSSFAFFTLMTVQNSPSSRSCLGHAFSGLVRST